MVKFGNTVLACSVILLGVSGCSNLPGVNVGASVPIGGIGSVGVGTTVGDGKSRAPTSQPAPSPQPDEDSDKDGSN